GGLGHEVHAAEDDGLGLGALGRGPGELEGVTDDVGMVDDFVALVEVPEDHDALAESLFRGDDAAAQLLVAEALVELRQTALAGCAGRDRVGGGCAGAVSGPGVDL